MPTRAVITSSDEDGDGAGAAWIAAKDSKEAADSSHVVRKRSADGIVPETPVEKARKFWATLAYQNRASNASAESESKGASPVSLSTPATKPNPIRLVPETPASFGAAAAARSKSKKLKVKPRRTIKRPSSYSSSSSSSSGGGGSSETTSDSEPDPSEKPHSPIVISHGSFVTFMDELKPAAAAANPTASAKELVSILNAQWRQMTPQQQQKYQDPHSPVVLKKSAPRSPSSPLPVMRKPPPPKVVQVESSEDEVLNISSSSSDSSSEGDSDESGSSSGAENDRDALTTVFNKCKRYATRLAVKISLFAADARMLEPRADAGAVIRPQPTSMSASGHTLQPFQLVGFNWLCALDEENLNCCVSDEMGLGKTIQCISFIAHLFDNRRRGPHLIVVPGSTLDNWLREFEKWLPDMTVVKYHGSQKDRVGMRCDFGERYEVAAELGIYSSSAPQEPIYDANGRAVVPWHVMITTYSYFEAETGSPDRAFLRSIPFDVMALDEAHNIKNAASSRHRRLLSLNCRRKVLLTGTPIANSLVEMVSLLMFLMPRTFKSVGDSVMSLFESNSKDSGARHDAETLRNFHSVVRPFVLRRLKCDVLKQMVPKREVVIKVNLEADQRTIYNGILAKWKESQVVKSKQGVWEDRLLERVASSDITSIFTQLRKAANHSLLVRTRYSDETIKKIAPVASNSGYFGNHCRTELALAELNTMSDHAVHDVCSSIGTIRHLALPEQALFESAKVQKVLQLLEELLPAGHRILLFSQWTQILDVLQDALQAKNYLWCRLDGGSKVEDRQSIIDEFNTNTSIGVFLISTRAGGVGINLTSADTVIIHDVDFNPQIDKQAQDRCHRVGQTKPVTVYRLVAVGTVDESVFECALRKEALAHDALNGTNDNESAPDKKEETREILRAMMQAVRQNFSETLAP